MDWSTLTNVQLLAVDTTTLSADDLQSYREEMLRRRLSTTVPPTEPSTPGPIGEPYVSIPPGIVDGDLLVYDALGNEMIPIHQRDIGAGVLLMSDGTPDLLFNDTEDDWLYEG